MKWNEKNKGFCKYFLQNQLQNGINRQSILELRFILISDFVAAYF